MTSFLVTGGHLGSGVRATGASSRKLYACRAGTDEFTSTDATCGGGGATKLADLGWAYTTQPANIPTIALYRCVKGSERFDSVASNCEDAALQEHLGYTIAYSVLSRYFYRHDWENASTTFGAKPGYERQSTLGLLAMTAVAGTTTLWLCKEEDNIDEFATTDAACAGKTQVASLGRLWTQPPPGVASRPIYLCQTTDGEKYNTTQAECGGASATPPVQLGHILTAVPPPGE